jgi:tRNA/rRNA methyltransferase
LLAHIPSNPDYSSLNLASAVQILSYELRCALPELTMLPADTQELAAHEEIELFYRELELTLISARFLNPAAPRRLMTRLRRLYSRTRLEKEELHFLMGLVKAMRKVD